MPTPLILSWTVKHLKKLQLPDLKDNGVIALLISIYFSANEMWGDRLQPDLPVMNQRQNWEYNKNISIGDFTPL